MRILTSADIALAITMPEAMEAMRRAFLQISSGEWMVPPRLAMPTPHGVTLSMPAYLPPTAATGGVVTVKVVSVNSGNAKLGVGVIQGAVLVFDDRTGIPRALIEGRALTALRTGAATGLATDLLARKDARELTIFGAGGQAEQQINGVRAVREITKLTVVRRGDVSGRLKDIVVTATNSPIPVFRAEQLDPGTHINAIGSYRPEMRELDEATMTRAKVIVDSREASRAEAGELQGGVPVHAELGEILSGRVTGRVGPEEVTVFKSVGNAVQDAAIAAAILESAERRGLGQIFAFG